MEEQEDQNKSDDSGLNLSTEEPKLRDDAAGGSERSAEEEGARHATADAMEVAAESKEDDVKGNVEESKQSEENPVKDTAGSTPQHSPSSPAVPITTPQRSSTAKPSTPTRPDTEEPSASTTGFSTPPRPSTAGVSSSLPRPSFVESSPSTTNSSSVESSPSQSQRQSPAASEDQKTLYGSGDVVWCRSTENPCYYPAVIVSDPINRICTRIVMSHELKRTYRKYHVQMLHDSQQVWIDDSCCIPYKGMQHYEEIAMKDTDNLSMYKPTTPIELQGWKVAASAAGDFYALDKKARVQAIGLAVPNYNGKSSDESTKSTTSAIQYIRRLSPKKQGRDVAESSKGISNIGDSLDKEERKDFSISEHFKRKLQKSDSMSSINSSTASLEDEGAKGDTNLPGEGALVWAGIKGYPFWPGIVSRDPKSGEFLQVNENGSKVMRKVHVLFLEYGNQRAWIGLSSIKEYKGLENFNKDKEKASKKMKALYTINKRHVKDFNKAVDYAEDIRLFDNDDRLEMVLNKYGWNEVEEKAEGAGTVVKGSESMEMSMNSSLNQSTASEVDLNESKPDTKSASKSSNQSRKRAASKDTSTLSEPDLTPTANKKRNINIVKTKAQTKSMEGIPALAKVTPPASPVKKDKTPLGKGKEAAQASDGKEFPVVGDLVWGRMAGYPYWPGFVTRNPEGSYKRGSTPNNQSYHMQFFGWNDESGWVTSVIKFAGMEAFKELGAKRKSDKSFKPGRNMQKKWEKGVHEAEATMALTRQERVDTHLVGYAHKQEDMTTSTPKSSTKSGSASTSSTSKKVKTQPAAAGAKSTPKTPASAKKLAASSSSSSSSKSAAQGKGAAAGSGTSSMSKKRLAVPPGWQAKTMLKGDGKEQVLYISPEGKEFTSKSGMYREISGVAVKSCTNDVRYLSDASLPPGWKCQKIQSAVYFFSPLGERFETRQEVVEKMKSDSQYTKQDIDKVLTAAKSCAPAPRCVKIARGLKEENIEESYPKGSYVHLPGGLVYRLGGPHDESLDCDMIFHASNERFLEIAQLPDIFLENSTVRVVDIGNETIISELKSGDFLAKKIIYD